MTEPLFRDDAYATHCTAVIASADGRGLCLDRTVFYAAGGGQPGDTGELEAPDGTRVRIIDTQKDEATGAIIHVPEVGQRLPAVGTPVEARIDWDRRYRHMRLHTCLHLLCAVVKAPVTGGRIAEDKAHLDFDIDMSALVKEQIESGLNALIAAGHPVTPGWISEDVLDARPELVRTMSVQPPRGQGRVRILDIAGVDLQPCGGTHVRNTAEIGPVQVVKIRNEGKRNRRVTIGFASA